MTLNHDTGQVEFGGWVIHLQAGIADSPQGYDVATSIYNRAEVVYGGVANQFNWINIDCQLLSVVAGHGGRLEQVPGVRGELGRLSAQLYDPDRILDPSASPFRLLMNPGVAVRLVAVKPVTLEVIPIWTGVSETFTHDLKDGTGSLVASDMRALIAGVDLPNWERPAENARQRFAGIIAMMPKPIPWVFSGAAVSLSKTVFSGSLWGAVDSVGTAEQSIVWVDQFGRLRRIDSYGTGPVIRADDCDDGVTPIIYYELSTLIDDEFLVNMVTAERNSLTEAQKSRVPPQFNNATSANRYGPYSLTENTLTLTTDAALQEWAMKVLALRAFPKLTVTGMEVVISDQFPWVERTVPAIVGLQVGNVLDVRLTSRGEPEQWYVVVAGIQHTIKPEEWSVQLELADGARVAVNAGYDAVMSRYDISKYDSSPGIAPTIERIVAALTKVLSVEEEQNATV